jgi:hypothetical protein
MITRNGEAKFLNDTREAAPFFITGTITVPTNLSFKSPLHFRKRDLNLVFEVIPVDNATANQLISLNFPYTDFRRPPPPAVKLSLDLLKNKRDTPTRGVPTKKV